MSHNHTDNSEELLSAYIDNAVDAGERRRAERYIDSCAACAQEVQELRMFRQLLRDLPNVQPRRSFTLDPATVAPTRRLLFPTLRWSSLVAALLFLVVVGVDVLGNRPLAAPSALPMASPAAESAAKTESQFDSSGATGGAADTMIVPQASAAASPMMAQASPAASAAASQENSEAANAQLPADLPATTIAAAPESAAGGAVPEASPAAAVSAAPDPAMARSATAAALSDPAGAAAVQQPQMGFQANEPAGADTTELARNAPAQGSWWSSYTLRIVEVALGLIALLLGGAALWTWRRQI